MLNERVERILNVVAELNNKVDGVYKVLSDLNMETFLMVVENDPAKLTSDMIVEFAKQGMDLTEFTPVAKAMVPPCYSMKNPKDIMDEESSSFTDESDVKEGVRKAFSRKPVKEKAKAANPILDDGLKRGVIFARCNKDKKIEDEYVDRLVDAADERDIRIQDFIINEKGGLEKLHQWIESGVINYLIINSLREYARDELAQCNLLDKAFKHGVQILIGENEFRPVIPPEMF